MSCKNTREWLGAIGLEQYAERFEENRIDVDMLAMTEDAMEVEPVGELSLKGIQRPIPAYNVLGWKR